MRRGRGRAVKEGRGVLRRRDVWKWRVQSKGGEGGEGLRGAVKGEGA